mgnify:CR=1 FL=1
MRPHIRPARQGRPRQWPTAFVPGRIEQGISTLMLRRTHSRQIHAGASFAEMAARSFTGLERKGGRCCTAPFRYAGQPVSKFPGFHGKQPRRRRGLTPFAALPPIRSALRHIKSSPASAVQGCLSYARRAAVILNVCLHCSSVPFCFPLCRDALVCVLLAKLLIFLALYK